MEQRRNWLVGIALFLGTLILYWPTTTFPFVNLDDNKYIYDNPHVRQGLSWAAIQWAFVTQVQGNWHPLTMLSHMLDCSLYRLFAGGHHLTNIILHAINVVLLWVLLRRITKLFWPATLAAALFAAHPLNVESVAWIAERKNVLSTLFLILTLLVYLDYAKNPRLPKYILALILFALGLMSKSMLVTLPFLLLLLDYWPLQRANLIERKNWNFLIVEKIPFFILTAIFICITLLTQQEANAVKSFAEVPFWFRVLNVPVAYGTYLVEAIWPTRLCAFYSFPQTLPVWPAIGAIIFLLAIFVVVFLCRKKFPWLLVGWLWFFGTLIPVIGVVQVGAQSHADRYFYVPMIGLLLILIGAIGECIRAKPFSLPFIATLASIFLIGCIWLTRQQIFFWRSSMALFNQVVVVNPQNCLGWDLLGQALDDNNQNSEALIAYQNAVNIYPDSSPFQYHLAMDLLEAGKLSDAQAHLKSAINLDPKSALLHNALGVAFAQNGKTVEAETEFNRSIELQTNYAKPYLNLGKIQQQRGQNKFAVTNFAKAAQFDSDWLEAWKNLAAAHAADGNFPAAISAATRALQIAQTNQETNSVEQIQRELRAYENKQPSAISNFPTQ